MAVVVRRWACALGSTSALLIGIGAFFGPWATLFENTRFRSSVSGLDSGNHGWLAVSLAVVGSIALVVHSRMPRVWLAAVTVAAGAAAAAVTLHDRHALETGFSRIHIGLVQALQSFVRIGWGLNLALGASLGMGVSALIVAVTDRLVARRSASSAFK